MKSTGGSFKFPSSWPGLGYDRLLMCALPLVLHSFVGQCTVEGNEGIFKKVYEGIAPVDSKEKLWKAMGKRVRCIGKLLRALYNDVWESVGIQKPEVEMVKRNMMHYPYR